MNGWLGQVSALLWKDLLTELRTRELLGGMALFAFLVLLTFNFAFDLRIDNVGSVAPGILWVAFSFAGILGLGRSFVQEKDRGAMDGLLVAPVDRAAIYLAKFLGNLFFMLVVEAIALPVFTMFFNFGIATPALALVIFLGTAGFAAVGTLFAAMAANTRARDVMLPLLVFPICVPVIIASVAATSLVIDGGTLTNHLGWLEMLAAFDLIFGILCFVVFEFVVEE
ncbi:MAG TPA: heme exporter protein CcmB [Chloroflexota bacterium]|nr:heme exporter protein CcmB [Chloroflexota bacterium]